MANARKRKAKPKSKAARRGRRVLLWGSVAAVFAAVVYGAFLTWAVTAEFDRRGWDLPAQIYAAPLELYAGRRLSRDELLVELIRLGYRESAAPLSAGTYRQDGSQIQLHTRGFEDAAGTETAQQLVARFEAGRIAALEDGEGGELPFVQLEPLLIGSIFPSHGEDRIVLAPDEIPPLLEDALIAVEDRRFERHIGVDLRAIARAALVNITNGEIRQGASTLTQQLVRSYFLSNEQTWGRKINEALMALALEITHDKATLMHAYVNEVYLGQDGARAIHGFGLGSRFYFGKPLEELDVHEIALLVGEVRGPSYYDPRRYPERALARRNLVLELMREQNVISAETAAAATSTPLDVVAAEGRRASYYAAFLDLVRRQLRRDYAADDLERKGIQVFSTLDPSVQADAEAALVAELDRLQPDRPPLEGAVIVTSPPTAEVRAVVGSRRTGYAGFNRALDAKRQIGSLIKPAVYLAALESGRYSLATLVDDAPIDVPLDNGTVWSPTNYDDEAQGTVTTVRALAESLNMATVRVGMDVGLDPVADTLARLGLEDEIRRYPSLLLGAIELTPLEVAQAYNTLANGGFRAPLKAVRAVVDAEGETLQRFGLEIEQAADATAVYALNQGLVQVMERGTGRTARTALPEGLRSAGKTGTTDGLRDSWFAGFTSDHLVVAWVGNDDNVPTGLTGSSGAGRVWARTVASLDTSSYNLPAPGEAATAWIDYETGLATDDNCPDAVYLAMTTAELPPEAAGCGSDQIRLGARLKRWLRNRSN